MISSPYNTNFLNRIRSGALLYFACALFALGCFESHSNPVPVAAKASALSTCGNGIIEYSNDSNSSNDEVCDDGNTANNDGCTSTCQVQNIYACLGQPSVCTNGSAYCVGGATNQFLDLATGRFYIQCNIPTTWATAKANCEGLSGSSKRWHLVRIDSQAEQTFVESKLFSADFWIGANDITTNLQFRWSDGDLFWTGGTAPSGVAYVGMYTHWKASEPGTSATANCVDMKQSASWRWDDVACDQNRAWICELAPTGCGDGILQANEECDDGNLVNDDGCDNACFVNTNYACVGGSPSYCLPACDNATGELYRDTSTSKEYFYCPRLTDWATSKTNCENIGSGWSLARIDSLTENNIIMSLIGANGIWIGANDIAVEGTWRWTDNVQFWSGLAAGSGGTSVGGLYQNWLTAHPSSPPDNSDCALISSLNNGKWTTGQCIGSLQRVCEGPVASICGDGIIAYNEDCDDGGTTAGDGCNASCDLEFGYECLGTPGTPTHCAPDCGDGFVVGNEACDDGNSSNFDACVACHPASCGDGFKRANFEGCDDGNTVSSDGCNSSCQIENNYSCTWYLDCASDVCDTTESPDRCEAANLCGNGAWEAGENCDDGRTAIGDGCSNVCTWETGFTCSGSPSTCTAICGDGLIKGAETCDDGNTASGDGCANNCLKESGYNCSGTPSTCTAICGDGSKKPSEACDDADLMSGDGCSSSCTIEFGFGCTGTAPSVCTTTCGDGHKAATENCDDGDLMSGDGCSALCVQESGFTCTGNNPSACNAVCGNGVISGAETCDDGDAGSGDGCSSLCQQEFGFDCTGSPSVCANNCGDGLKASNEQCDDGNTALGDGCNANCAKETGFNCSGTMPSVCASVCGDSITASNEQCDDGNISDTDACVAGCMTARCGDGFIRSSSESCDDNNMAAGDGCSPACLIEAGGDCSTNDVCEYHSCDIALDQCDSTDSDGDGTPDAVEMQQDTNPNSNLDSQDSDGDGHPDYVEEEAGSNPNNRNSVPLDSDDDGVPNIIELRQNTNPSNKFDYQDSNNDGVPDYTERGATSVGAAGCSASPVSGGNPTSWLLLLGIVVVLRGTRRVRFELGLRLATLTSVCLIFTGCFTTEKTNSEVRGSSSALSVCGNNTVESGEVCDDGNTMSGDMCSATCQPECPGGIATIGQFNGKRYLYCSASAVQTAAQSNCLSIDQGWRLVRIDSAAENSYVNALRGMSISRAWIGASDGVEGDWRWQDSDQFWEGAQGGANVAGLYQNWTGTEPNASNSSDDCADMGIDGTWADANCSLAKNYICESSTSTCGDGVVDADEECDDGDQTSNDGCDHACYVENRYVCTGSPSVCALVSGCTTGSYRRENGTNYFVCEQAQTWTAANNVCAGIGQGWSLVRVDDSDESAFTLSWNLEDMWIGASDAGGEGRWRWTDGDLFWYGLSAASGGVPTFNRYSAWRSSEPGSSTNSNCASILNSNDWWDDISCGQNRIFMCEGPVETCGNGVLQEDEECDDGNTSQTDGCDNSCRVVAGYACKGSPSTCVQGCFTLAATRASEQLRNPTTAQDYFYCDEDLTWSAARTRCQSLGSGWDLLRVNSAAEQNFLTLKMDNAFTSALWIGGRNVANQPVWIWTDTVPFWSGGSTGTATNGQYTQWSPGMPSTTGSAFDSCALINDLTGNWSSASCSGSQTDFICEGPVAAICGDGIKTPSELCDDANSTNGDGCDSSCVIENGYGCNGLSPTECGPVCGDGLIRSYEPCDDHNNTSGDGCSATCTLETGWNCNGAQPTVCTAVCGDGMVRGSEACDDGNASNTDSCLNSCTLPSCGDGYTRSGVEQCDDANASNADSCLTTCLSATCGDGFIRSGTEQCDDDNTANSDGCNSVCARESGWSCTSTPSVCSPTCGDGLRVGSEPCDDADLTSGDGCSNACNVEFGFYCVGAGSTSCSPQCGDGVKASIEACDDANMVTGDGCTNICTLEPGYSCSGVMPTICMGVCGNGVKTSGEGCDDGDLMSGDGCSNACTAESGYQCSGSPSSCESTCGDGVKASNEQCDDGNTNLGDGCNVTCIREVGYNCSGSPSVCASVCGDAITANNEQCDDGNASNIDGCLNNCHVANCGDGYIRTTYESCDDGNLVAGDGCSVICSIEDGSTCSTNSQCEFDSCDANTQTCDSTDNDGDGVPNAIEIQEGTDPESWSFAEDSDGDGHPDYVEEQAGSNPYSRASVPPDSDSDGVPNLVELRQFTNPNDKFSFQDSDNNGVADYKERGATAIGSVGCSASPTSSRGQNSLWSVLILLSLVAWRGRGPNKLRG